MIIQHNISALNSHRNLGINNDATSKNLEKLSSGYRINRAGDDAAGLAISEKMRGQIRGLSMAEQNTENGISLIQTAEGGLNETQSILQRMRELAVQSSNGTYQDEVDRENLELEFQALKEEITRIADSTHYNSIKLLDGSLSKTGSVTMPNPGGSSVVSRASAGIGTATIASNSTLATGTYEVTFEQNASGNYIATFNKGKTGAQTVAITSGATSVTFSNGVSMNITYATLTSTIDQAGTVTAGMTIGGGTSGGNGTPAGVTFDPATTITTGLGTKTATPYTLNDLDITGVTVTEDPGNKIKAGGYTFKAVGDDSSGYTYTLTSKDGTGNTFTFDSVSSDGDKLIFKDGSTEVQIDMTVATMTDLIDAAGNASTDGFSFDISLTDSAPKGSVTSATALGGTIGSAADFKVSDLGIVSVKLTNSANGGTDVFADGSYTVTATWNDSDGKFDFTILKDGSETGMDSSVVNLTASGKLVFISDNDSGAELEIDFGSMTDADLKALFTTVNDTETFTFQVTTNASVAADIANFSTSDTATGLGDLAPTSPTASGIGITGINVTDGSATPLASGTYTFSVKAANGSGAKASSYQYTLTDGTNTHTYGNGVYASGKVTFTSNEDPSVTVVLDVNSTTLEGAVGGTDDDGYSFTFGVTEGIAGGGGSGPSINLRSTVALGSTGGSGGSSGSVSTGGGLVFQIGANGGNDQRVYLSIDNMAASSIGLKAGQIKTDGTVAASNAMLSTASIDSIANANEAIEIITAATNQVSSQRAGLGALQNRLEHTLNNLGVTKENLTAAESSIRDVDMAKEMMEYTKNNILIQASQAMLAQANQLPQGILQLLR